MKDYVSRTKKLNKDSVADIPQNKPVVYKILDRDGENIYTGVAGRGNVQQRILDHLIRGKAPVPGGTKVQIEQRSSIDEAKKKEELIIARSKPKYNKQGK